MFYMSFIVVIYKIPAFYEPRFIIPEFEIEKMFKMYKVK